MPTPNAEAHLLWKRGSSFTVRRSRLLVVLNWRPLPNPTGFLNNQLVLVSSKDLLAGRALQLIGLSVQCVVVFDGESSRITLNPCLFWGETS